MRERYKEGLIIMGKTESARSPLGRLVFFMVCLSVAGAIVAGAHYAFVDLPQQNALQVPTNDASASCAAGCSDAYQACIGGCSGNRGCNDACYQNAVACANSCGIEIMG